MSRAAVLHHLRVERWVGVSVSDRVAFSGFLRSMRQPLMEIGYKLQQASVPVGLELLHPRWEAVLSLPSTVGVG